MGAFTWRIGDRVFINRDCYFDLTAPIPIGDNVMIGHHSRFVTVDHEIGERTSRAGAVRGAPIVVVDGVWIGCGCIIRSGVTNGRGSVVGAGSLVRKEVPPDSKVAGVPAAVIGTLA